MMNLTNPLAIALTVALSGAAFAQDTPATDAAPSAETAPAAEAPTTDTPAAATTADSAAVPAAAEGPGDIGKAYTAATHGDWQLQCIRTAEGNDPCEIYQVLKDTAGQSVADISILALPAGSEAVAGATIMVPLETLLTPGVALAVDGGQTRAYPVTFCAQPGCFVRVGLTAAELASFKGGNKATLSLVPVAAPDKRVDVEISLKGFTAAYDAVKATAAK
jgi:invasion protein IalB